MGKVLKMAPAVASCAVALASCNTSGCLENQNSIPLAGFYDATTGNALSVDSIDIGGVGAPNDSLLNAGGLISQVYLPLRSTAATTSFYFRYTEEALAAYGLADTITFDYTSHPYFASEECGAMYRYEITHMSYTTHIIDSVEILDSLVTNTDVERIKIYFRTATSE